MSHLFVIVVIGLLGGIAIGLQAPLASMINQRLGVLESVFVVHLGGLLAVSVPLILLGGGKLGLWQSVPWYALAAGFLGVVVVGATVFMVPRIGVAGAITLIISGQLLIATTIDHFGVLEVAMKPISTERVLGLGIILLGVWQTLRS
ncbi:MAG: DMT family transporter [Gammaproteobacteria bacterium]|nr:DMT family transporter [Gammaproteobacteria bacterium]